jgi:peptidoglycan/xylan/chitin deacetylase (PgdA/CDA1 family)
MPPKVWRRTLLGALSFLVVTGALVSTATTSVYPVARVVAWLLAAIVAAATVVLLWHLLPDFDLPGGTLKRLPRGRGRIALTFDDGPNGVHTSTVLDVLAREGAHATFFVVGESARRQPGLVRRMVREGHEVGNHTFSHALLPLLPTDVVARQLDDAQRAIVKAGAPPPRFFRAPKGFKHRTLHRLLTERSMTLCGWTRGVWDTDRPGVDVIVARATTAVVDGAILLLHDGLAGFDRSQTAAALERILALCRERGLTPVTLAQVVPPPLS